MATRLIGTDTADPRLPAVVIAATQGTTSSDLAPGDTLANANAYTDSQIGGAAPSGTIYYVHPTAGSDANDGRSPGSAFATVAAAFTNAPAGSEINLMHGTHVVTNLTAKTGFKVVGTGGETRVSWASTTGNVFDLTGCSDTTWRDMQLIPNGVQKTAGALFYVPAGTLRNRFENLYISSPYRAFQIEGSNVTLRDISFGDYNATWPQDYSIGIIGAAATSVSVDKVVAVANGQAGQPNGLIYLASTCSSITIHDVIYSGPGTGSGSMIGLKIDHAQWVFVTNCEFESGTSADACVISGESNGIHLHHNHFLGVRGVVVQGTPEYIRIEGGECVKVQQHGIHVTGGTNIVIRGVHIRDASQATTNTYDGVHIAAGVTDFAVDSNTIGTSNSGNGNVVRYGVNVATGASNRYQIVHNQIRNFGTLNVFDGGSGTTKIVGPNDDAVDLTAATTPIVDAGNAYAATNVETALTEIAARFAPVPRLRTAFWHSPISWATATVTPGNGVMYGSPFILPANQGISDLAFEVTGAAGTGGLTRVGVYELGHNTLTATRLADAGTTAVTTTGVKTIACVVAAVPYTRALWLVAVTQGAPAPGPTYRTGSGPAFGNNAGHSTAASAVLNTGSTSFYLAAGVTGALPASTTSTEEASQFIRVAAKIT